MPELVEVDCYRRLAEVQALGRPVAAVRAPDPWYLKGGLSAPGVEAALAGMQFAAARRRGKLLLLDTETRTGTGAGPVLGLRFGMSGRLVVDGTAGAGALLHSPPGQPRFDRFAVSFADGGSLRVNDPRRLGGVELDPDEAALGPDALAVTPAGLARALAGSAAPLKARLLDQSRLAGVGNLIADEILWRASLSPLRPAGGLAPAELRRLGRHLRAGLAQMIERGGSHTGDLMAERRPGGACPADGAGLVRSVVGGRTTWWCPRHQH
ncbi:MAG: Fpg/Nei family DNA glycosylase [Acidimicrobiales bacterium]